MPLAKTVPTKRALAQTMLISAPAQWQQPAMIQEILHAIALVKVANSAQHVWIYMMSLVFVKTSLTSLLALCRRPPFTHALT